MKIMYFEVPEVDPVVNGGDTFIHPYRFLCATTRMNRPRGQIIEGEEIPNTG